MLVDLIVVHVTGSPEPEGQTGDVLRLSATGNARKTVQAFDRSLSFSPEATEVRYDCVMTRTGKQTFQDMTIINLADLAGEHLFSTLGSGFVLDRWDGRPTIAASFGRRLTDSNFCAQSVMTTLFEIDVSNGIFDVFVVVQEASFSSTEKGRH